MPSEKRRVAVLDCLFATRFQNMQFVGACRPYLRTRRERPRHSRAAEKASELTSTAFPHPKVSGQPLYRLKR